MSDQWADILQHYIQQTSTTVTPQQLFDLSSLGIIAVTGPDAKKFLQGQLTTDVEQITQQSFRLSAF